MFKLGAGNVQLPSSPPLDGAHTSLRKNRKLRRSLLIAVFLLGLTFKLYTSVTPTAAGLITRAAQGGATGEEVSMLTVPTDSTRVVWATDNAEVEQAYWEPTPGHRLRFSFFQSTIRSNNKTYNSQELSSEYSSVQSFRPC